MNPELLAHIASRRCSFLLKADYFEIVQPTVADTAGWNFQILGFSLRR
jgi:hypothetical protein